MTTNHWRTFPRWMLEEHAVDLQFAAQLSTGRAHAVTARIQREPATLLVLLKLLGDAQTALSVRIGIGVVMEDLTNTHLLQQYLGELAKLTEHTDARIRADACHYLGLSGDARAIPWLQSRVETDTDREVRDVAADALAMLGG